MDTSGKARRAKGVIVERRFDAATSIVGQDGAHDRSGTPNSPRVGFTALSERRMPYPPYRCSPLFAADPSGTGRPSAAVWKAGRMREMGLGPAIGKEAVSLTDARVRAAKAASRPHLSTSR
jgi:hypothetical protein